VASRPKFSVSAFYHPASASASSSCNAGLILTKVVLVASLSAIEIMSFTLRSSPTGNCYLLYNIEVSVGIVH